MLPRKLPQMEGIDIEPFIQTATEVGGDYYDVLITDEDALTVVIGDATGHGVKAGMVVATAKSYFHTFAPVSDPINLIRNMSYGIKNMHLHMLYMSLAVLRIQGRHVSYVGAGMPPILIYRASTGSVETMISKGMPLGSIVGFPYKQLDFDVQPGDAIVMMSDGLTEAHNRDRDMLGLENLTECLLQHGGSSARTISESFQELIRDWTKATPTHDDITVIALKFT
jgi:serine phosphatase RsbU (regulator of sigma subunit)